MTAPLLPNFYQCILPYLPCLDVLGLPAESIGVVRQLAESQRLESAVYEGHEALTPETRARLLIPQIDRWNRIGLGSNRILQRIASEDVVLDTLKSLGYYPYRNKFGERIGIDKKSGTSSLSGVTFED
jgi:hypothetical protein